MVDSSYLDNIFNYGVDSSIETEEFNTTFQPSRTYRVDGNRIMGMIDNLDAIRQAVEKLLLTKRFGWVIYSENYGSEVETLIGRSMTFAKADIQRAITDAVLADDRIDSIENFEIIDDSGNTLVVKFDVHTVNNIFTIEQEVTI